MRRFACVLVLVLSAAGIALAAGGQEPAAGKAGAKTEAPVPIVSLIVEADSQYPKAETPTFKKIQEMLLAKFNIQYTIQTGLSKEFKTMVNLLFASGQKLPDLVDYRFSDAELADLYKNGMIIKLNDLIKTDGPEIKKLFDKRPLQYVINGLRDGTILRVPSQYVENPQHRVYMLCINLKWLDKVGLGLPKTPDDLYKALKAFQDKDANENGKRDDIFTSLNTPTISRSLGNTFGAKHLINASDSFYFDANNKIYQEMLTPATRDYVAFLNKLYSEKLLDNDYMDQTTDSYNQKLYTNRVALTSGPFWDGGVNSNAVRAKGYPDAEYMQLTPLAAPGIKPTTYVNDVTGYGGYMITKTCARPDKAMQVLNYGYSLEGTQLNYYGEIPPGGNWYGMATPEKIKLVGIQPPEYFMEYTEKGYKRNAEVALVDFWGKEGFNSNIIPQVLLGDAGALVWSNYPNRGKYRYAEKDFILNTMGDMVDTNKYGLATLRMVAPTDEQSNVWKGLADLWVYMDETIDKFISGVEPMSNWDAFVRKCKDMGIDKATAIIQERFDAYRAVVK